MYRLIASYIRDTVFTMRTMCFTWMLYVVPDKTLPAQLFIAFSLVGSEQIPDVPVKTIPTALTIKDVADERDRLPEPPEEIQLLHSMKQLLSLVLRHLAGAERDIHGLPYL